MLALPRRLRLSLDAGSIVEVFGRSRSDESRSVPIGPDMPRDVRARGPAVACSVTFSAAEETWWILTDR
jgi:hypothetical protein